MPVEVEMIETLKQHQVKVGKLAIIAGGHTVLFETPFGSAVKNYVLSFDCINDGGRVELASEIVQRLDGFDINVAENCKLSYIAVESSGELEESLMFVEDESFLEDNTIIV